MSENTRPTREVRGQYRALCCECGNLRYVSRRAQLRRFMPELPPGSPALNYGRFTCDLKCEVCSGITRHALIRDGDSPEARTLAEDEFGRLAGHGPNGAVR